jgi:hypothetical protein
LIKQVNNGMSILTQTPQPPTDAEKLQRVVKTIKTISSRTYDDLVRVQKQGIDSVWKDRDFTPQEIIDALGTNAIKVFNMHGKLTDYLVDISAIDNIPYTPALPTNTFTINADGSITVTDQPYTP